MAKVAIEMIATLSGDGESWGPGSVVQVEAEEAERLIGLGAAVAAKVQPVEAPAKPVPKAKASK